MKIYRQKVKENPDRYKAHLEAEAQRNRAYRANLSETEKDRQRDITRIRVQKWREKQKVNPATNQIHPKNSETKKNNVPKTRNKIKEMRDYWRLKKQQQRENMSVQKKRRINEGRREKYANNKDLAKYKKAKKENPINRTSSGYTSKDAERKAVYRANKCLPSTPQKFASVLSGIAAKATPRKRAALDKEGIILTPIKKR